MIFIVFPDQLYKDTKLLTNKHVILIEDSLYFHDPKLRPYKYSKIKLAYMRASMKFYESYLKSKGIRVTYRDFDKPMQLAEPYEMYAPNDLLIKDKYNRPTKIHDYNPNFILTVKECLEMKSKRHSGFYNQMKKKLNILTDTPNLDKMNRKTMSRKDADSFTESKQPYYKSIFYNEAIQYVSKHFPNNPGILSIDTLRLYPCSFNDAERHLNYFIDTKLKHFGELQDYIHDKSVFMYHSNISCILNNGLITPQQVIYKTMGRQQQQHIPINSLEGFIRQVIGWREYMRYIYFAECNDHNISNKWNAQSKLTWPESPDHPVNVEIEKVNKYAYAHHIVRLMVLLNWLVLNKVKPHYVIQWFSEMFIDAYPWNMYSNILTMGYYNRNYTHKSYVTSSNYILKMSNYKRGKWAREWDIKTKQYV